MDVDRAIYWRKHVLALVITCLLFVIGLLIGLKVSDSRLELLQGLAEQQKADFESLQLQYAYLTASNGSCLVFRRALDQSVNNLETARIKLENYIQTSPETTGFLVEKRTYMLAEIRYWLLAREAEKSCGKDSVNVLFFYENDDMCGQCSTQGYVLTSLKNIFKEKLLIFSLDGSSGEPMVQIIKGAYNITTTPSVVVDNEVVGGFVIEDDLTDLICLHFPVPPSSCFGRET